MGSPNFRRRYAVAGGLAALALSSACGEAGMAAGLDPADSGRSDVEVFDGHVGTDGRLRAHRPARSPLPQGA